MNFFPELLPPQSEDCLIQNKQTLLFQDRVVIRKWCTKILSIRPSIYQGWALGVGVHLWADSQETEMLIKLTLLSPLWNYLCYRIIIICMCILCGNTGSRSQYRSKLSCSWSSEHISSLITLGSVEDSDFNVNKTLIETFMKRIQIIKRGQSTPTLSSLKIKQNQCHQCLGTTFSH